MSERRKQDRDEHRELVEEIRSLRTEIKPMLDVFTTLKSLGKWIAILVAFLGSLTAIAVGFKALFKK